MLIPNLVAKFHLSVTGVSDVLEILAQHGAEVALPDDLEVVGASPRTPPRKARSYWQGGGRGQRAGSMVGVFLDASHAQPPRAECDAVERRNVPKAQLSPHRLAGTKQGLHTAPRRKRRWSPALPRHVTRVLFHKPLDRRQHDLRRATGRRASAA
jgi:hypothetical protein